MKATGRTEGKQCVILRHLTTENGAGGGVSINSRIKMQGLRIMHFSAF